MSGYRYVKDRRLGDKAPVLRVRQEIADMILKDPDIVEVKPGPDKGAKPSK